MSKDNQTCERSDCDNEARLICGKWLCSECVPLALYEECAELRDSLIVLRDVIIRTLMSYKIIRKLATKCLVKICGNPVEYYCE